MCSALIASSTNWSKEDLRIPNASPEEREAAVGRRFVTASAFPPDVSAFKTGPWTQADSVTLLALKTGGASWAEISEQMPSRSLEELKECWSLGVEVSELRAGMRRRMDPVVCPFRPLGCLLVTARIAWFLVCVDISRGSLLS